jgi:predicted NBD/HSP70 family sugar kinase
MNNQSRLKCSIGIDIGGTKIKAILWNGKKVIKNIKILTPNSDKKLKLALLNIVKKLKPKKENFSIGIGAAGIIKNYSLGRTTNISGIKNFNFKKIFPPNILLSVDNDARCFLKSELALGSAKGAKNVFGLTIGTGIGRAWAKNGHVQKIKIFESAESWEKEYQKIKKEKNYDLLADFLGKKISLILKQYDSKTIIIGGGTLKIKNFFEKICQELKKQKIKAQTKRSKLGENAGAIGSVLI